MGLEFQVYLSFYYFLYLFIFNDWEFELVDSLMDMLYPNSPVISEADCMRWKLNFNGKFNICS